MNWRIIVKMFFTVCQTRMIFKRFVVNHFLKKFRLIFKKLSNTTYSNSLHLQNKTSAQYNWSEISKVHGNIEKK